MGKLYLSLVPWAVFDIGLRHSGPPLMWAAVIAIIATIAQAAVLRDSRSKFLTLTGLISFGTIALCASLVSFDGTDRSLARVVVSWVLSLGCYASSLAFPFTEKFCKHVTTQRFWQLPEFRHFNIAMSRCWSFGFAVIGASFIAGSISNSPFLTTVFSWLVPMIVVIALVSWTERCLGRSFDLDVANPEDLIDGLVQFMQGQARQSHPRLHLYLDDGSRD